MEQSLLPIVCMLNVKKVKNTTRSKKKFHELKRRMVYLLLRIFIFIRYDFTLFYVGRKRVFFQGDEKMQKNCIFRKCTLLKPQNFYQIFSFLFFRSMEKMPKYSLKAYKKTKKILFIQFGSGSVQNALDMARLFTHNISLQSITLLTILFF